MQLNLYQFIDLGVWTVAVEPKASRITVFVIVTVGQPPSDLNRPLIQV